MVDKPNFNRDSYTWKNALMHGHHRTMNETNETTNFSACFFYTTHFCARIIKYKEQLAIRSASNKYGARMNMHAT